MVGLERSVLPIVGERDFGLDSRAAILSFVVAFGLAKALSNLVAGWLADRVGRATAGIGLVGRYPGPDLDRARTELGLRRGGKRLPRRQPGLAWSMTVVMKIDLVGPRRRGLALGLNESAGYLGVALAAFATGALAVTVAPRTVVWVGALIVAGSAWQCRRSSSRTPARTSPRAASHGSTAAGTFGQAFFRGTVAHPVLRACSQAGLVNNLNDALAAGALYLAANGATLTEIGIVAAVYPAVWGRGRF